MPIPYKATAKCTHHSPKGMSENRSRNEAGQFTATRSPSAVLAAMEPLEPYTTGELAAALDWPRRSVYKVLSDLADDDEIRKKKPEPRRAIWIRPEEAHHEY